ncbi:MAG: type I-D CRISPR-associated helicase Cas3', partial [Spirochaetota bacterium]
MQISGTTITLHHHPAVKTPLYPHQCVLFDSWNEREAFILATKTGSGKTAAAALPVIHFRESAVFVYPTNALIEDQERSILGLLEREGYSARVFTPENSNEKYGEEDYHLVRIDASRLEEFRRALKMKDKSQTLLRLIQPSRPKILLINPDLLYLIFSLKYGQASAELTAHFTSYRTAIFDEFHMYSGIELAHALFMVHLIREFGGFNRLVLLSATPYPEVLELLNKALKEPMLINTATNTSRADIGERLSAHSVNFVCQSAGADEVESCFEYLQEKRECLEAARRTNPDAGYVPAVVILNSVVSAIR